MENTHTRSPYQSIILSAMVLVIFTAALMRIYHITQQSIWFDEAFAWNIIRQPDMFPRIAADTHPPLYYLFLRGWVSVAGESPLALRYLSAIFGILSVAVTYRIGVAVVRQRRWTGAIALTVPIVAALILAITDAEIDLAQEARNYTLYTLFACLSMWMYLRWIDDTSPQRRKEHKADTEITRHSAFRTRYLVLWIIFTVALMYTHYQGAFIPAIQGLHALLFLRGRKRLYAIGALSLVGLIFAPWFIGVTVPQAQNAVENDIPFSIPSNWQTLADLRDGFLTRGQWVIWLVLMLVGLMNFAPHVSTQFRRGDLLGRPRLYNLGRTYSNFIRPISPTFLVLMWILLPFVLLFFGNFYAALLTERKLALVTPAIALLVAFGLGNLRQPALTILLVAILGYGVLNVDFYRLKEPWDELANDAVIYAGENDLALIEVGNGQYPMRYYWEREMPAGAWVDTFPVLGDPTMSVTTDWFTYYDLWLPQLFDLNQENKIGDVATVWLAWWYHEQTSIERLETSGYVRTMTTSREHLDNTIYLYRYDMLPATPTVTFENGMVLNAVELDPDDLRVDLWWSTTQPLDREYVTSALLFDSSGALVAQLDSVPYLGERSTLSWSTDDVIFDPKWLALTDGAQTLAAGDYTVEIQVYTFTDGAIENIPTSDGDLRYTVGILSN
ncbi:MAG: glycosyltransferase family 39 protein [Aggregatilineales bacterium]